MPIYRATGYFSHFAARQAFLADSVADVVSGLCTGLPLWQAFVPQLCSALLASAFTFSSIFFIIQII